MIGAIAFTTEVNEVRVPSKYTASVVYAGTTSVIESSPMLLMHLAASRARTPIAHDIVCENVMRTAVSPSRVIIGNPSVGGSEMMPSPELPSRHGKYIPVCPWRSQVFVRRARHLGPDARERVG